MCLAVPLKITEIQGNDAIASRSGVSRAIRVDFIKEPKVGDYVLVHAGFAIERLSKEDAELSQELAREVEEELLKLREEAAHV